MSDTLLAQLRKMTTIVADSGDFETIARFKPVDSTTNPSLIAAAARMPQYDSLVSAVLVQARDELRGRASDQEIASLAFRRLAVAFGKRILALVPGRVSTEVDARLSFDQPATLEQARDIIAQYHAAGISEQRVLIKIAGTWDGIQAARILEDEGIHCNVTLVFGLHQAAACADANVTLISPFVGRIRDWHSKTTGVDYGGAEDPGVQSVKRIYGYMKQFGYGTSVMGASFRNIEEIKELAGCDLLTISPKLLSALDSTRGELPRRLSPEAMKATPVERLSLDRNAFEQMHSHDVMARQLLSDGIDGFSRSLKELEGLLTARLAVLEDRPMLTTI